MLRRLPLFTIALIAFTITGCTKSEDDLRKAQRETAGLMPDNDPKFEAEYVADQSQVKLVAARNISYEPLDTFRGKSKSKSDGDESASDEMPMKKQADASPKSARATGAAPPGAPSGGNFWSRVGMKALMGGGAPPPAKPPTKGGKPDAKGDKADDKDADEEESEEEDSGDEESKEADSDGN